MTALRRVEPSMAHIRALSGRMTDLERWAWGLGGAGEAEAHPQNLPAHDLPTARPAGVGVVHALGHVGCLARSDQAVGLRLVHDDQHEAQAFEPVGQQMADAPCDAAAVTPVGRFDLGAISVGPADPVVKCLLGDSQGFTSATKQGGQAVLVADDHRFDCHLTPQIMDAPHG